MDAAMRFKLRLTEKKGQNYFTVEKNEFKGRVDRAHVKITAINPEQQPLGKFGKILQNLCFVFELL